MTDRDKRNRRLAEWVGWTNLHGNPLCGNLPAPDARTTKMPDFYTDESANAMLLEKMKRPLLERMDGVWRMIPDQLDNIEVRHADLYDSSGRKCSYIKGHNVRGKVVVALIESEKR